MAKYETEIDPDDTNQSQSVIVDLVGRDKHVLDVGCSTGYVARGLIARGCTVSGLELEADWAEEARDVLDKLVIGDLDTMDLVEAFGEESFDVVVFGDVLEHVKDPGAVLLQTRRLLRPKGSVVISMPNVAHGDLRLSLLAGYWDYRDVGLLDETHLRFFTKKGVERLMRRAGYFIVDLRRVRVPMFSTELSMTREHFDPAVVRQLEADPEIDVYQYVFRALKDDVDGVVAQLAASHAEKEEELAQLQRELATEQDRQRELSQRLADQRDEVLRLIRDRELARLADADAAAELERVMATRTFRLARVPRMVYGRLRRRP
jgi:2-polyprenyl-3-methyl-5-hydroxy-6-metoxy-1,4-benzoquinol methylase